MVGGLPRPHLRIRTSVTVVSSEGGRGCGQVVISELGAYVYTCVHDESTRVWGRNWVRFNERNIFPQHVQNKWIFSISGVSWRLTKVNSWIFNMRLERPSL